MVYVKHKEITKSFDFSKALANDELPGYIKHYVCEDEIILAAYKTSRDHGVFTLNKMVLFDNVDSCKQMYTIAYSSISTISVLFNEEEAELNILLDSGYPLRLRFVNVKVEDKIRLRLLYTCINRIISGQQPYEKDVQRLVNNDVSFK